MRKCVYCKSDIHDNRTMEICDRCGEKVWGKKMFDAIKKTTDEAKDKGDLEFNSCELPKERAFA
ncbi:hypothetical protein M0R19_07415 [Candidatus Pacearchaeota archaeon]|nr:hypothetical protein [Candidatus Pacearchaeota archaeon]